jgi:hypothetical protein
MTSIILVAQSRFVTLRHVFLELTLQPADRYILLIGKSRRVRQQLCATTNSLLKGVWKSLDIYLTFVYIDRCQDSRELLGQKRAIRIWGLVVLFHWYLYTRLLKRSCDKI